MIVFVLNGSNQTGKNKFSQIFRRYINSSSIFEISTVDILKKLSKKFLGWDGKKTDEARKFLSEMKRVWVEFNNGPFQYVVNEIEKNNMEYNFIHCREPEEIQKFKDYYGDNLVTILMINNSREVANNQSDQNVGNYDYDYKIDNNGTVYDLEQQVIKFIEDDLQLPVIYPYSPMTIDTNFFNMKKVDKPKVKKLKKESKVKIKEKKKKGV